MFIERTTHFGGLKIKVENIIPKIRENEINKCYVICCSGVKCMWILEEWISAAIVI
jgi:hypothetical protein